MTDDLLERLERPAYTGENRCTPCTVVNLVVAAVAAALVGRRNRALGIATFLAGAGLIYLRGYLVPGTPELTKRYLPEPVLAAFGKSARPEPVDESIGRRAADRAASESAPADDGSAAEAASSETDDETDTVATDDEWVSAEEEAEEEAEVDGSEGGDDADDGEAAEPDADDSEVTREELDELLEQPMDRILESFAVVEEDPESEDLVLVDAFHDAWVEHIEDLAGDADEQGVALAELYEEPTSAGEVEVRDDDRFYGLVDGTRRHSWITEAAVVADLAADRVLEAGDDPRWGALEPKERLSILRGFRVFLTTCPECGGPVSASDDVVESCCGEWDVIAVGCEECDARVLELTPPDARDTKQAGAGAAGKRGITR